MSEHDDKPLPPEIVEIIKRGLAEGVTFSIAHGDVGRHVITGIHWRPGEPNKLAEVIIAKVVDRPMPLELDGHHYMIIPDDADR